MHRPRVRVFVLSSENLSAAASIHGAGPEYRVTYRTADQNGAPTVSSGAVHLPPGPVPVARPSSITAGR